MADKKSLKLCNILETSIRDVDILEKRILKILKNKDSDDDEANGDADDIENNINLITKHHYATFESIDRTKRTAFWNELNSQMMHLPTRCLTPNVQKKLSLLKIVCHFDFNEKPLSFAFEAIHNMDTLTECENQLLGLIDRLRNEHGLNDILDTQYQSIRNQQRKIVLAVAGGLKVGKSSFINYLLKSKICPEGVCETTARLTKIMYGPKKLVKLESITGELKEQHEIHDDEEFKTITKGLIALKGADRNENLCKDIVTIHLDRNELEYIELWDIPGYDENPFLNSIVEDILKQTNIYFILSSSIEAVRDTTVNLLRSCSEKHGCQPQVCFIVTKIDQVTTNPNAEITLDEMLDRRYDSIQDRFKTELGEDRKSSPFFIPLCTDPRYNLEDFFDSHEQFTRKLTHFFTHAVRCNTLRRLNYLTDTIHELLDYDDVNRIIERDNKLSDMLANDISGLRTQINEELAEIFIKIHQAVAEKMCSVIELRDNDVVEQALIREITEQLLVNDEEIGQRLTKCMHKLYSKLEKNPALTALVRSMGERRLFGDPYRTLIGQYKYMGNSFISSAECFNAAPSTIDIYGRFFSNYVLPWISPRSFSLIKDYDIKMPKSLRTMTTAGRLLSKFWPYEKHQMAGLLVCAFGPLGLGAVLVGHEYRILTDIKNKGLLRKREQSLKQAQTVTKLSVETMLQQFLQDISTNLCQSLCEQLNNINDDIRNRKAKLIEEKRTGEAQKTAEFLKKNNSCIVRLYLNLLDKANHFKYPRCKINLTNMLGTSNFPVFSGEIGNNTPTDTKRIAAKRIPLERFNCQEVRYINELVHQNILCYYGVRKSEGMDNHYDILMQRLDSDLTKYIDHMESKGKINDKIIDEIFLQIINGLGYVHEKGLIHRDIKPENILVQLRNGQSPIFVLADFGFIHRVPISIKGTQGFLAPELLTKSTANTFLTSKIDMYALGATIRQVLENSSADKKGKYVQFWAGISERCLLDDPFERPTCQQILDEHNDLI